jgi:hypothetical protein
MSRGPRLIVLSALCRAFLEQVPLNSNNFEGFRIPVYRNMGKA